MPGPSPSASAEPTDPAEATEQIVRRLPSPVEAEPAPERQVVITDHPRYRLRKPGDLLAAVLAVLGLTLALMLAVLAPATTEGVTEDLADALPYGVRTVLISPVNWLVGLVVFVMPATIVAERLFRRQRRLIVEALLGAVVAGLIMAGGNLLLASYASRPLLDVVLAPAGQSGAFSSALAAVAAFLTMAGTARYRLIGWTWNLLWLTLVLQLLIGGLTLPSALVSVLTGRAAGLLLRYLTGTIGDRAYGADLVRALRRCGIDVQRVERLVDGRPVPEAVDVAVVSDEPIGYVDEDLTMDTLAAELAEPATDPPTGLAASAPIAAAVSADGTILTRPSPVIIEERPGDSRIYSVRDYQGKLWDVAVLDGDRQVVGTLSAFWAAVRFKGISRQRTPTLQAAMDRAALMSYAATAAGTRTPELVALTSERESAFFVSEHIPGALALADVDDGRLTDDILHEIWQQVRIAHAAGLAHRNLDDAAILLDRDDQVWLTGWADGEVSSPALSRLLDLVHVLALLAHRVGAERAVASAARVLTADDLEAVAPLFQRALLPDRTKSQLRSRSTVLEQVQHLLVGLIPAAADLQPVQMRRFSPRVILTVTVAVVATVLILTSFNLSDMIRYLQQANPWWLLLAFALGMLTYLGAALSLVALSPIRISLSRTILVQAAASAVSIVTPAGIGPAALNLRFLQKSRLDIPMAVATVTLVQVSQIAITVLMLLVIAIVTGTTGVLDSLPSGTLLLILLGVVVLVGGLLAIPTIRRWVLKTVMPTLRQIWPRLAWVIGQPRRLIVLLIGNVLTTGGYVASFGFTLLAFGETLPLSVLVVTFLAANAAGSAVPTPGGIGAVELALTTGLRAAGINGAGALSTAFVYRLLTFWIRIPLGWLALTWLQRRSYL